MTYGPEHEKEICYFARTNFRNEMTKFGIKTDDRRRHLYVIGKTGMGKTTMLENLILSDIYAGHGCCYVDPHGDTAEKLINYIPKHRINDVVYFNPADLAFPVGFNAFEITSEAQKHLLASGMMSVFKKIWENMWSSRMEYILNNTILALLDNPGSTMLGINRLLSDADYRKRIVGNVKDPVVKQFWLKEFAAYNDKYAQEAVAPIQNKIGQFLSASVIRNIVAQVKSTINIREIMDENKIFIVNLSKGRIGEDSMRLLGGLLISKMQLSAMERVDMPEVDRKDFYLYVDEFQNFATESFASILSEARKYRLCLTMAHQYIAQLTDEVREAVFGNVGTIMTYRVGSVDAQFMETEFAPRFTPEDLINIPKFNIYLKLLIDGVTSHPFSAAALPPIGHPTHSSDTVIKVSRERYAKPRAEIEDKIMKWTGMEDLDIDDALKEAAEKKKAAKQNRKPMHEYNCTECNAEIRLPVELDRSRPIYCETCIEKVRARRKGDQKKNRGKKKEREAVNGIKEVTKPKIKEGELVTKEVKDEKTVSLSDLVSREEVVKEEKTLKVNAEKSVQKKEEKTESITIERVEVKEEKNQKRNETDTRKEGQPVRAENQQVKQEERKQENRETPQHEGKKEGEEKSGQKDGSGSAGKKRRRRKRKPGQKGDSHSSGKNSMQEKQKNEQAKEEAPISLESLKTPPPKKGDYIM
jgi:DNA-directed RNA polymerase subunit RPC12/RpoP